MKFEQIMDKIDATRKMHYGEIHQLRNGENAPCWFNGSTANDLEMIIKYENTVEYVPWRSLELATEEEYNTIQAMIEQATIECSKELLAEMK